jgi:hypothetical protein
MSAAATNPSPCQACPADPPGDRDATALPNLETVLRLVQILLTYGRHLADTLDRRSISPGFHLIARHFGTSRPAIILAHIRRGILRAAALRAVLLARRARGRDLVRPPVRVRLKPQPQPPAADQANPAEPEQPKPARKREPARSAWRDDWLDNVENPLDPRHMPTFQQLLKEARRHPIGRTLGKIYADLGIAPALSLARFWNDLFLTIMHYDGSPGEYDVRRWRREQHFEEEQERCPTMDLTWPPVDVGGGRSDILRVMGFLIGEPPVEPPLILPPEPPPWARPKSTAPAAPGQQGPPPATDTPPKATGPP